MLKLAAGRPIIYGEVLFDCFPDGSKVLGGAPFNVAWHLQGFGLNPLLISSVGDDEMGHTILSTMNQWYMDISGIQISQSFPTGQVSIMIHEDEPSYDIVAHQAYDNIEYNNILARAADGQNSLVYHGSLIRREVVSRASLQQLIEQSHSPVFVDINLRPPWWQMDDIRAVLQSVQFVKLNVHELVTIMALPGISATDYAPLCRQFFSDYNLQLLIVTLGEEGAFLVTAEEIIEGTPVVAKQFVDTVGAGDSFSAVLIAGLIKRMPLSLLLQRALEFSVSICEIRGATTTNKELYDIFL